MAQIFSVCQVLTLEVGTEQHPTALKAMELPCVKTEVPLITPSMRDVVKGISRS